MEFAFDAVVQIRITFQHTGLVAPRTGALEQQTRLDGFCPSMCSRAAGVADKDTRRVDFHGGLRELALAATIQYVFEIMALVVTVDGMAAATGQALDAHQLAFFTKDSL